jgi:DNA-3-methyladenine glycosylase I
MPRLPAGLVRGDDGLARCWWPGDDALYRRYHDDEWGFPVASDRRLFEKLCLEGFQAGLSWITILRKRESFRRAFQRFDFEVVARYDPRKVERLLKDPGIVRNRAKIQSVIGNARRARELVREFGSLAGYFWSFAPAPASRPRRLTYAVLRKATSSPEARALSRDLKQRGWTFVGPTTLYAFMQAVGLVNDHLQGCAARARVQEAAAAFRTPRPGSPVTRPGGQTKARRRP